MGDVDPLAKAAFVDRFDLLRAAVETADDAIIVTTATMTPPGPVIEYVNPAFTRITGYQPFEVVGRSPRFLEGPKTDPVVLEEMAQALLARARFDGETVNYRKDGSEFILSWRVTPVRDAAGEVTHWLAVHRDVTAQRRTEMALRQVEERYRIAARATNDVIWDWDLATDTIEWNEALTARLGYDLDAVDPSGNWWSQRIHPDDRRRVVASVTAFIEDGATRWAEEYRFRRADGSYADILDRGYVMRDVDGRAVRMVGAMLDLSEERRAARALRESEERLRLAVEVAGLATWDVNLLAGERRWSPEFYRMLGLPEDGPADPAQVLARLHPDDRPTLAAHIKAA